MRKKEREREIERERETDEERMRERRQSECEKERKRQREAYMDRRSPVLAPSALGNRPPVQNWIEEEQGSIILRSGTVSEAPYIRIATPKIRIPPKTIKINLF